LAPVLIVTPDGPKEVGGTTRELLTQGVMPGTSMSGTRPASAWTSLGTISSMSSWASSVLAISAGTSAAISSRWGSIAAQAASSSSGLVRLMQAISHPEARAAAVVDQPSSRPFVCAPGPTRCGGLGRANDGHTPRRSPARTTYQQFGFGKWGYAGALASKTRWWLYLLLSVVLFFVMLHFIWMLLGSVKPNPTGIK
jgi:hypothetical protein